MGMDSLLRFRLTINDSLSYPGIHDGASMIPRRDRSPHYRTILKKAAQFRISYPSFCHQDNLER